MSNALACPHCGETRLWSDEPTTIMYPVQLTRTTGDCTCENTGRLGTHDAGCPVPTGEGVAVEYTGDSYEVMDEGTEYVGNIWCRTCGRQLAESDLVTREECSECREQIEPDDVHSGHGMCGSCLHDAERSGWTPGD